MLPRVFFLVLLFLLNKSSGFAQFEKIEAQVVLKGSSDTLLKHLSADRRIMKNDFIKPYSVFARYVDFYDFIGKHERIKQSNIGFLRFTDFQGIERTFIDASSAGIENDKVGIVEIVYSGTIKFYRNYQDENVKLNPYYNPSSLSGLGFNPSSDSYGLISGDTNTATFGGPLPFGIIGKDYFSLLDYKTEHINLFEERGKKELAQLLNDDYTLYQRIIDVKTYEQLILIFKDYDSDTELVKERIDKLSFNSRSNRLNELSSINIDSVKSRPIKNSNILVIGDYIKYVGPGLKRIGIVRKVVSENAIVVECDLMTNPRKFTVRAIDVELILD